MEDRGPARALPALLAATGFALLLGLFLAARTLLIRIPIDVMDPYQKSAIGLLAALALLVLQPFACRFLVMRRGATAPVAWWAFVGGVVSSALLFFPALILFME